MKINTKLFDNKDTALKARSGRSAASVMIALLLTISLCACGARSDEKGTAASGDTKAAEEQTQVETQAKEKEPASEDPAAFSAASDEGTAVDTNEQISPELKDFLDSYEVFIDEYVSFMENYDASNLASLMKYADLVSKLNDFTKKADAWDEKEMSDAELYYYIEVINRSNEKLYAVLLK